MRSVYRAIVDEWHDVVSIRQGSDAFANWRSRLSVDLEHPTFAAEATRSKVFG